jgi:putative ABC transport system substrate-binding protein
MKRRTFIAGLGSTAAWPVIARAQQAAMPVIGYLSGRSSESDMAMLVAVRRGLEEVGYVEGRNVAVEYRFADGQLDRVPALGMELTARRVAVIVCVGSIDHDEVVRFIKTSQIPVVFGTGADPVRYGLVSSFNHPGGNLTGMNSYIRELTTKVIELLRDLMPRAKTVAALVNSNLFSFTQQSDARRAAASLGLETLVLRADTDSEIEASFVMANQQRLDAVIVTANPFFLTRAKQIKGFAARYGMPTIYPRREFAEAGGLMSYGFDVADGYRRIGNYAGRILNGEKAGDLPVFQPTKFELVVNLKTAKALGLTIPETLLATADDVIQ